MMNFSRKTNRRQFLRGESAIEALGDLAAGASANSPQPAAARSSRPSEYLMHVSRRAMACEFAVFHCPRIYPGGVEASLAALDAVSALEESLSIYREDSEASRVNRTAAEREMALSSELADLIAQCLELHAATDGAFDITAGPLAKAWGFFGRAGKVPAPEVLAAAREVVGSGKLQFDRERKTIRFARPGMELSFNSIGKGLALDRAAAILIGEGVGNFLLHGGASSILAQGSRFPRDGDSASQDNQQAEGGWQVGIRNPLRPERRLAELTLRNRALATSGSATQFFYSQGKRYGHILDPRTGYPAEQVLSATAIAPTAAEADALSTAFYVLGVEGTAEVCSKLEGIGAVLVSAGKQAGEVIVDSINVPDADLAESSAAAFPEDAP